LAPEPAGGEEKDSFPCRESNLGRPASILVTILSYLGPPSLEYKHVSFCKPVKTFHGNILLSVAPALAH